MQLHERIKEITSKQQLADFVEALRNDYETNANEWGKQHTCAISLGDGQLDRGYGRLLQEYW
jgi:hypothetical protein